MAHAERIEVAHDGPVTTVVINRPAARNACSVDMIRALHTAFTAFEEDEGARVAVLTGVGESFCAGADLREIEDGSAIGFCWAGPDQGVTRRYLSKPVIAAVNGPALAAGLALAVWCDLRVAAANATFGVSCRRFGGPMPNGATVRLPRLIGQSHALDLMLTGRTIDADEAHRMGLVNRVVAEGTARQEAEALARDLAIDAGGGDAGRPQLGAAPVEPPRGGRHPLRGGDGQGGVRRRVPGRRRPVRAGRRPPRRRPAPLTSRRGAD